MNWFRKTKHAELSKAAKRCASLPTYELLDWAGNCLNGAASGLRLYEDDAQGPGVADALIYAEALVTVLNEMKARQSS